MSDQESRSAYESLIDGPGLGKVAGVFRIESTTPKTEYIWYLRIRNGEEWSFEINPTRYGSSFFEPVPIASLSRAARRELIRDAIKAVKVRAPDDAEPAIQRTSMRIIATAPLTPEDKARYQAAREETT